MVLDEFSPGDLKEGTRGPDYPQAGQHRETWDPGEPRTEPPYLQQQKGKRQKARVGKRGRDVVGDAEGPARQGFSAVTEAACSFMTQPFLLTPFPAGPAAASQNKQLP